MQTVLRKYTKFEGRASLAEYWWWNLAVALAFVPWFVVYLASLTFTNSGNTVIGAIVAIPTVLLLLALSLGSIVLSIAVTVRRLHDTDQPGSLCFLALIPLVGSIILLVLTVAGGTCGDNQYGPDPLGRAAVFPPAPQALGAPAGDSLDRLRRLGDLHASGVVSDGEFAAMKAEILEGR
ncbi:DUF805 domain-containing protein [Xylanimonas sp. McL0601]|uniref:DUF805 domain-containing protein n=1 Tax=Xylanimonas sp. McL0601 TaxID=3414739 RepID=UPI003CF1A92B